MRYPPSLILNTDYKPHDIWDWEDVMAALYKGTVHPIYSGPNILKYNNVVIRDGKGNEYDLPAVLVLKHYASDGNKMAPPSKINVYARDMGKCGYCGDLVKPNDRTVDHVIPRAHWNPARFHFRLNSFENLVTACKTCNFKKRNRTPAQAGMTLLRKLKPITRAQAYLNKIMLFHNVPKEWKDYINY